MCATWPTASPEWISENYNQLMKTGYKEQIPKVTLQELIEKSEQFPVEFPIQSVRCQTLINHRSLDDLEKNINSVYPVVHETALHLYSQFLEHKKKYGTRIEKELYQNMTLEMLIDRLLTKRAVMFVGSHDKYLLLDGKYRAGGWEKIGTISEEEPLILKDCLSYDEMKLSALLSVSSHTEFINSGSRANCGKVENDLTKIEQNGVIVGLIGARLGKLNVMEYQETVVSKEQNVKDNGYGNVSPPTTKSLFLSFYGEPSLTYKKLKKLIGSTNWFLKDSKKQLGEKNKFIEIGKHEYFNNAVFEKRLALSIDTLLIEANARAEAASKMAYVHVVGIGLGVWKISQHQDAVFMDTFARRIEFLSASLSRITDICFSYIKHSSCGKYNNGDLIPVAMHDNNGIRIHILNKDPHEKLQEPCEGKLLVASYAWDGNALPGNEFWARQLATSSDPAAASSTQVAELHNPHINSRLCGVNLRVATLTGLITLGEYQQRVRELHDKSHENATNG